MACFELCKTPTFLLKLIELVASSLCIVLFIADHQYITSTKQIYAVIFGTFVGFIMINIIVIAGYVIGRPLHKFQMLMATLSGGFLYLASGGLVMQIWTKGSEASVQLFVSSIIGLLNGIIYLVDFGLIVSGYDQVVKTAKVQRTQIQTDNAVHM